MFSVCTRYFQSCALLLAYILSEGQSPSLCINLLHQHDPSFCTLRMHGRISLFVHSTQAATILCSMLRLQLRTHQSGRTDSIISSSFVVMMHFIGQQTKNRILPLNIQIGLNRYFFALVITEHLLTNGFGALPTRYFQMKTNLIVV